jgi:hypothetical protein
LHNIALFWFKNANVFAEFFGENILKIITSVPGSVCFRLFSHSSSAEPQRIPLKYIFE